MKYFNIQDTRIALLIVFLIGSISFSVHQVQASERASSVSLDELEKVVQRATKAGLSAQQIEDLVQRGRNKGLSNQQLVQLILPAAELSEQDLPGHIVIQKAFEGLAKGVPPNRIEPVILDLKTRIQKARDVVDPWMKKKDKEKRFLTKNGELRTLRNLMIEATAHALSGTLSTERVADFLNHMDNNVNEEFLNSRSVAAAVRILPDLITTKEHPDISNKMLVNAINAGFTASEFHQLPNAMEMAQNNSRLPAKAVANGFTRQIKNGIAANQILQNLQKGNVEGGDLPPKMKQQPKGPDKPPAADKKKNGGKK